MNFKGLQSAKDEIIELDWRAKVTDGSGNVYLLNKNIPEHSTYIHCAVEEDYARKELERLQRNPRYFDGSYFDQLKNAHDKVSKFHRASRKALGECFDEYKETPLHEGELFDATTGT